MDIGTFDRELSVSCRAAVEAGQAIMEVYERQEGPAVTYKEDNSPLTEADRRSNDIILRFLRREFPDYGILSEEEKDDHARLDKELCFVVDPLDGTKEFIKRNGQFTVNIGLARNHRIVMGVIYVPASGQLYFAAQGMGAWRQLGDRKEQLHVSGRRSDVRVVMSSSHGCSQMEKLIQRHGWKNLVSMGSSLKGCLIAAGEAEIYYRYNPTMEWDTAAMQCIVEEAGGLFRQMDGSEMCYNRQDSLNSKGFYVLNSRENWVNPE